MKKTFLVMVFTALFVVSSSVAWAETKPCPHCWAKLKDTGIKSVSVTPVPGKNAIMVHMSSIKQALEKAGINEPVSIFLSIGDNNPGCLGSFTPSVKDDGEHGDGQAGRSIFRSIPGTKNLKVTEGQFVSKQVNPKRDQTTAVRPSTPVRPSRPSSPEDMIRPSRPSSPEEMIRPARPSLPEEMTRPSRPARPSGPAGQVQTQTPPQRQGLLTFKNSQGQAMVYLPVEIVGM